MMAHTSFLLIEIKNMAVPLLAHQYTEYINTFSGIEAPQFQHALIIINYRFALPVEHFRPIIKILLGQLVTKNHAQ